MPALILLRKILRIVGMVVGMIMWFGAGLAMIGFYFIAMQEWLGFFGLLLAFILGLTVILFPITFWIVEGYFPVLHFALWGVGFVGMTIFALCHGNLHELQ